MKNVNKYGPVLFELDLDVLNGVDIGKMWVTRLNPSKWAGRKSSERWFTSKKDLENNFISGEFNQMIIFRHCGGKLDFHKHLKKIILDDPAIDDMEDDIDLFSMAYGSLRLAMSEGGIDVPIEKRNCASSCKCAKYYEKYFESYTRKLFFPEMM